METCPASTGGMAQPSSTGQGALGFHTAPPVSHAAGSKETAWADLLLWKTAWLRLEKSEWMVCDKEHWKMLVHKGLFQLMLEIFGTGQT